MRDQFVGLMLVFLGVVNAVPSAAAINPIAVTRDYIEDDLAGSGQEASRNPTRHPQRRQGTRLRLLSPRDRVALLRAINDIPAFLAERVPGCANDVPKTALIFQLVRAVYDQRPLSFETLVAGASLPPELVLRKLRELEESGLVQLKPRPRCGVPLILPTPALRVCADEVLDRLYYGFVAALTPRRPVPS